MKEVKKASQERPFRARSAWPMVFLPPLALIGAIVVAVSNLDRSASAATIGVHVIGLGVLALANFLSLFGFFVVGPNTSRVLVLFGRYRGTVRTEGFFWTNPFTSKKSVSLKAWNVASEKVKVNDKIGNPIEIGAVVVWQVRDTAQALFDVEHYHEYVNIQIETAIRQLATHYPYDSGLENDGEEGLTLRGNSDEISQQLTEAIQGRLDRAGIAVIEARLSHLAYAQEIASAMLQRQQASAVIAARRLIVEGAVGMVEHALEILSRREILELDAERRASLVGNLLVVLCGDRNPTPVLNTGGLYN